MPVYRVTSNSANQTLVIRQDEDGMEWWLGDGDQDAGYLAWLAEGNTPEPWEATNGAE